MSIKRLDHVSILVREPEKVLEFYEKFLGFELISRREVPEMGMNIFNLKARGDFIEIIQPKDAGKMPDGIKHIAFLSDNIEGDFRFFKENGAVMLYQEVQKLENIAFFFVKSPSGELVEIIQYF